MLAVIYSSQGKDKSKLLWNIVLRIPGTSKPHKFPATQGWQYEWRCLRGSAQAAWGWRQWPPSRSPSPPRGRCQGLGWVQGGAGDRPRPTLSRTRRTRPSTRRSPPSKDIGATTSQDWLHCVPWSPSQSFRINVSVITSTISSWVPEMPTEVVLWPCTWANRSNTTKVTGNEDKLDMTKHRPCLCLIYVGRGT